uniref:hypothetical protein n=1 Tax=Bradyrhizobium sp. (strain ORS 278) TaxID=114615 RepID=UPI0012FEA5BF|nr:hypothetical protein [Bradyrhizobium sp. ORS 278]
MESIADTLQVLSRDGTFTREDHRASAILHRRRSRHATQNVGKDFVNIIARSPRTQGKMRAKAIEQQSLVMNAESRIDGRMAKQ